MIPYNFSDLNWCGAMPGTQATHVGHIPAGEKPKELVSTRLSDIGINPALVLSFFKHPGASYIPDLWAFLLPDPFALYRKFHTLMRFLLYLPVIKDHERREKKRLRRKTKFSDRSRFLELHSRPADLPNLLCPSNYSSP